MAGSRPQFFTLDQDHPLAKGLVFAGLGCAPGSSRYNDSSGKKNDGVLTGTPSAMWTYFRDIGRWSICTAAGTDHVKLARPTGEGATSGSPFSISIWIGPNDVSVTRQCIARYDGTRLFQIGHWGNTVYISYGRSPFDSLRSPTGSLVAFAWSHVAFTFSSTGVGTAYLNGVQFGSDSSPTDSFIDTVNPLWIGLRSGDSAEHFVGYITDVMIYSRVLSVIEIDMLRSKSNPLLNGLIRPIGSESNIYDREGIR